MQHIGGFEGMITSVTATAARRSGYMTFWGSQEAIRTSEEAVNELREESAEAGDDTIAGTER